MRRGSPTKPAPVSAICPEHHGSIDFLFEGRELDIYFEIFSVMNLRFGKGASAIITVELDVTSSDGRLSHSGDETGAATQACGSLSRYPGCRRCHAGSSLPGKALTWEWGLLEGVCSLHRVVPWTVYFLFWEPQCSPLRNGRRGFGFSYPVVGR